jgi:hypothetical protein
MSVSPISANVYFAGLNVFLITSLKFVKVYTKSCYELFKFVYLSDCSLIAFAVSKEILKVLNIGQRYFENNFNLTFQSLRQLSPFVQQDQNLIYFFGDSLNFL